MRPFALFASPVLALLAVLFTVLVVISPVNTPALATTLCSPSLPGAAGGLELDKQQLKVSAIIITVGKELKVPPRGWVVALATAMQESGIRPLPYGDRDSLGVFQQRAAWGTEAQRMNPASSARMFFTGGHGGQPGLLDVHGWESMPVTVAAQTVQVSAYPDAYARWEPLAVRIVSRLAHVDADCEASGGWVFPLGDAPYTLTAGYGDCGSHWADCHTGQDFAAATGTPVVAASDGQVMLAGANGPYGNAVRVLHADGVATWYAHLSRIHTRPGAHVETGQVIGLVGSTGNSTGPHLHFEVRHGASTTSVGSPTDPLVWLRSHNAL